MSLKIYEYKNCSTCKKALKFLKEQSVHFEPIPIVDQPPNLQELKKMLEFVKAEGGSFKSLFNTSGEQYRALQMSEKIKSGLSEQEALKILSTNGKLIKRPFLISEKFGLVGFQLDQWRKLF